MALHNVRVVQLVEGGHLLERAANLIFLKTVERDVLHDDLLPGAAVPEQNRLAVDASSDSADLHVARRYRVL